MSCTTCFAKPKQSEKFNRHCPNPTVVEKYLCATQGFSGSILDDDIICYRQQTEFAENTGTAQSPNFTRNKKPRFRFRLVTRKSNG